MYFVLICLFKGEEFKGNYIALTLKAVKSWLKFNGVNSTIGIKINGIDDPLTLAK
ncbi:hypothetical protein KEJ50_00495 [Candidatus Bathyarchaeota archaeon]|nr:hypothetical protein [Candidatus Bathyarchaeota archaeon]